MNDRLLLNILVEFATTLPDDFSVRDMLSRLDEQVVELLPVVGIGVLLLDDRADQRLVAATDEAIRHAERAQLELGEGPCLVAHATGQRVAVPDLRSDERFPRYAPTALEAGLRAVFSFPLRHRGTGIGSLELYARSPGPLTVAELDGAQILADVVASYVMVERRRVQAEATAELLSRAALQDPLTGLANRHLLTDRLQQAMDRSQRTAKAFGVLFCDIDDFKAVNDSYGHAVGDRLLVAISQRLLSALRPADTLARVSGDEFVVLCEGVAEVSRAEAVARRLLAAMQEPFEIPGVASALDAHMSVGIALAGAGPGAADSALVRADAAMYEAKRRGGQRYAVAGSPTDLEALVDDPVGGGLPGGPGVGPELIVDLTGHRADRPTARGRE